MAAKSGQQCRVPTALIGEQERFSKAFDLNRRGGFWEEDDYTTTDDQNASYVSDCESSVSGNTNAAIAAAKLPYLDERLVRLNQGDNVHDLIKHRFLLGLGSVATKTDITAIHKNIHAGAMAQARAQVFQIYLQAMEKNRDGNPNVKYAWYGCSKEDVPKILSYGFDNSQRNKSSGLYGSGIYLVPDNHPLHCVRFAPPDTDGLRHFLLCRVILGRTELVRAGSDQTHPSSGDFDSGVDSEESPRKFIIWGCHMNTHVLPEYVVSFRMPSYSTDYVENQVSSTRKPNSPWMPFPSLIAELSKILPPPSIRMISTYLKQHTEKKMSRQELIGKVRLLTGDKLLVSVIKSFRAKHFGATSRRMQL